MPALAPPKLWLVMLVRCAYRKPKVGMDITAKPWPFRVISNWTQATLPSSNAFEPTANAREHLTFISSTRL